ncbi:hypothetical protein MLD38_039260 [Melastoma candidum]|uniref:Uncharacterized protein n=1 Tax=Melastoma candidum TaxID=119954 RepID=A0ACB9L3W4_9MYRT|nr:hypothetical protein MLD38_039260 [Melastoma candidum]
MKEASTAFRTSYMIRFIFTAAASEVYSLCLLLTQLAFWKLVKQETFKAVLNMPIYQYHVERRLTVGLILDVSALFSNLTGTVGLPVIPVLTTTFFHDGMNGIKIRLIMEFAFSFEIIKKIYVAYS